MNYRSGLLSLIMATLVSSCGSDALSLAEGGMTGTGMTAGSITGFGSIYVNGIHYNVDNASFYRNGLITNSQNEFNVGEFVVVYGTVANESGDAVANEVVFNSLITGEVTAITSEDVTIEVMGQLVVINDLTVLHGVESIDELELGNVVEVSGVSNTDNSITASSLRLVTRQYLNDGSEIKVKGVITNLSSQLKTFKLGNLEIDYAGAQFLDLSEDQLTNGLNVSVMAFEAVNNQRLVASQILSASSHPDYQRHVQLKIEGAVTAIDSSTSFSVNGQQVTVTDSTVLHEIDLAELVLNDLLEVEGVINAQGVLRADEISSRYVKADKEKYVHFEGEISQIDYEAMRFVLQGDVFIVGTKTLLLGDRDADKKHPGIRFEQLEVGNVVKVDAIATSAGAYRVLRLDINSDGKTEKESHR